MGNKHGIKDMTRTRKITLKIYDHNSAGFFKRVQLDESYIVDVLGFDRQTLQESSGDMSFYEQVYNEHIVFEGFMDSIKKTWEKTKKMGGETSKVIKMLSDLFNDTKKLAAAKEQAMTLALRSLKPIISRPDVMPKVKSTLEEMESMTKAKQGWKGFLYAAALLLFSETVRDNVDAFTMEGVQQTFMKMLEDFHNDIMADSPINTVTSWLARIGKIFMKGTEIIGDLHRILSRVGVVTSGKGVVVDDPAGSPA
jgi:hypothetical protein